MTASSPKGPERKARPLCNCAPCQREAAARNAPIPYLRRQVAELVFDALEESQRSRDVLPIHNNTDVDAAAAAVVALVAPELERLTAEVERLRTDLAAWTSGRRRKAWPRIESVPDGIHYAAELVRAQGTEGGDEHDRLLREASQRLKALHDIAQVLLADRAVRSDLLRGMARRAVLRKRQARLMAVSSERFFHANVAKAQQVEQLQAQYDQAVEDWGRNDEQVLAENQRLADELAEAREQVERTRRATQRSIAAVLTGMLDELETAYVGEFGDGPAESRDKLRAVQAFSVDLFATSGPVELDEFAAPVSESVPATPQHFECPKYWDDPANECSITIDGVHGCMGSVTTPHHPSHCCACGSTPPEIQANSKLAQNLDEGHPSGSGAPAPQSGVELIADERARQVAVEGWTPDHDATHNSDDLAMAAVCYSLPSSMREMRHWNHDPGARVPVLWPWHPEYWKSSGEDRIRDLVKAGALVAAEIDRLQAGGR